MNQLFGAWACSVIRPLTHEMGLTLKIQGPRKYLAYRDDIESNVFQMKPDISLLNQAGQVVLIADAKWKSLSDEEKKLGVSQADMYQMSTYGARYMSHALALIYPRDNSPKNFYQFHLNIEDASRRLAVATSGLEKNNDQILLDNIRYFLKSCRTA